MENTERTDDLRRLLRESSKAMRASWVAELEPLALSPFQWRTLRVVVETDGARPGQVAEQLRIAPRSATEAIDQLAAKGLVERRSDPSDRRATLVQATPEGRDIAAKVSKLRDAHSQRFFGVLTEREQIALEFLLKKLAGPQG